MATYCRLGEIECIDTIYIVFHTADQTYALNGLAKGHYADISPIWRDNPSEPGTKVNIYPLIERGLALRNGERPKQLAHSEQKESERGSVSDDNRYFLSKIQSQVERVKKLISEARNPAVELDAVEVTQNGEDLVIRGSGRNVGDASCIPEVQS